MSHMQTLVTDIIAWQRQTFPGQTFDGVVAHLRRELDEVQAAPDDPEEWADVFILAVSVMDLADHTLGVVLGVINNCSPLTGGDRERANRAHFLLLCGGGDVHASMLCVQAAMAAFARLGVDAETVIRAKLDVNKARRWKAADDEGVFEHVKDPEDNPLFALLPGDLQSHVCGGETVAAQIEKMAALWRRTYDVNPDVDDDSLCPECGEVDGVGLRVEAFEAALGEIRSALPVDATARFVADPSNSVVEEVKKVVADLDAMLKEMVNG